MEVSLIGLKSQLDKQSGMLKSVMETMKELKAENAMLRREILGLGPSTSTSECMGLMENKTLRAVVEEMQFDVKGIKASINASSSTILGKKNPPNEIAPQNAAADSSSGPGFNEPGEEYAAVVDIVSKTQEQYGQWMKTKFYETKARQRPPKDGGSLGGRTVEAICASIPFYPEQTESCCVMKLSNFLDVPLTFPQSYDLGYECDLKVNGPSVVLGRTSEVFRFLGRGWLCGFDFLFSVRISDVLRLTIFCKNDPVAHAILVGIAFTPANLPTNDSLYFRLVNLSPKTDIWIDEWKKHPAEVFVNCGKIYARAHVTLGPRSVLHVDILEDVIEGITGSVEMRRITDSRSTDETVISNLLKENASLGSITCVVEIANTLNVSLNNWRCYRQDNCLLQNTKPSAIPPFTRKLFLATNQRKVEAMFSYEIDSTDLGFRVALRAQANRKNSFAIAFVPQIAVTDKQEFNSAMHSNQWKSHPYKKYAAAKDGEQIIEIRNIRATVKMTSEKTPRLKIRIFAV